MGLKRPGHGFLENSTPLTDQTNLMKSGSLRNNSCKCITIQLQMKTGELQKGTYWGERPGPFDLILKDVPNVAALDRT